MANSNIRILVTSAAGRTGTHTVKLLRKMDFSVRAMVRQDDHRAEQLRELGAEAFIGDQWNFYDLLNAMKGVQRAYHCAPFAPNLLENLNLFALAAEQSKLEVVALMSAWNGAAQHPSIHSRSHWLANQIYRMLPNVDVIFINPGLFAFTYFLSLPVIVNFGQFVAPLGEGLNAPPSNEDIARVAAHVLAEPGKHIGKNYRPTGPELLSPSDIAAVFSKVLERRVTYRDVPFSMFAKAAKAQGFPLFDISQMAYFTEELKRGAFAAGGPTDHVEEVCGAPAESFENTARRYFEQPHLVHPDIKKGNPLSAFGFMAKMLFTPSPDVKRWEHNRGHPQLVSPALSFEDQQWLARANQQQLNLL